jgi:GNAT superfamily N-acetyltransferase
MPTQILSADTPALRLEAYRFRYRIYVETMGRRQIHADHARQVVREPLDESGRIFIAVRHGQVVGTVRGNTMDDPATAYYHGLYMLDRFGQRDPSTIQMTTKLMIDPFYSGTGLPARLISAYAAAAYSRGVQIDLIDCNKHLISFFLRLGYFPYCGWRFHKEYGSVKPMFLALDALRHLRAVGSFLEKPAARLVQDGQYGGYELIDSQVADPPQYGAPSRPELE